MTRPWFRARRARAGVSLTELMVALTVTTSIGLVGSEMHGEAMLHARRTQCASVVEAIRKAEILMLVESDEAVEIDTDFGGGPQPRTTPGLLEAGWKRLGLDRPPPFAGKYTVENTSEGFSVVGLCDVDGDGQLARYEAAHDRVTTLHPATRENF